MATSSSSSILGVIQHYQRNIERSQSDEARLLHCIEKLYQLPVKVEHLQETGIGKTVNSLRKFNGEIGVASKALVTKWKAMVAAEEEPVETCSQMNENENNGKGSSDDDQYDRNRKDSVATSKDTKHSNGDRQITHRHPSKERNQHKHRDDKEGGSSSRNAHHNEKVTPAESASKNKHSSSRSQSQGQEHHHSEKRETEKHHKSRDREHRTDHKEKDLESRSEHGKDRDKNSRKKQEKQQGDEEEKETNISPSSLQHKRKREESEHHTTKDRTGYDKKSKHKKGERSAHSSSSREKGKQEHHRKSKDTKTDKDKSSSKEPELVKQKSSTCSTKPSTSAAAAASERKRNMDVTDEDGSDIKSPDAKVTKTQKSTKKRKQQGDKVEAEPDDGIDSSMGANFADVLGMLNMPTKKSKKTLNHVKSPISGNSKSGSSKDTPNTSQVNGIKSIASTSASTSAAASKSTCTSRQSLDKKPELLSSSAKLEPLDPSIVLELPTISNNYKPLPLNQTIMDCVFGIKDNSSVSKAPPVRTLTDAEAYSHGISSKTMRTKIYSGVKTGQIHQVPSLFDLCIRVLQKNIDALEYTGGVPFEVLRSVLERATPQQLLVFEEYNPYLMEDSDVLWKQHVQRQYRTQKRQEMESWREMFLRCQEDQERKLNILAESIKLSQKVIAAPVRKTQLAFLDTLVKPPRNVLRKQEQYGTKAKLAATPAARVAALSSVTPNAAKPGDVRLRVAAGVRDTAQVSHAAVRPKKAPLMAKTLQFMRGRHKR